MQARLSFSLFPPSLPWSFRSASTHSRLPADSHHLQDDRRSQESSPGLPSLMQAIHTFKLPPPIKHHRSALACSFACQCGRVLCLSISAGIQACTLEFSPPPPRIRWYVWWIKARCIFTMHVWQSIFDRTCVECESRWLFLAFSPRGWACSLSNRAMTYLDAFLVRCAHRAEDSGYHSGARRWHACMPRLLSICKQTSKEGEKGMRRP